MFTGLIEDVGVIVAVTPRGNGHELRIRTHLPMAEVAIGDSIAVDGVCLTAETVGADEFSAVAGRETLTHTTLSHVRAGRSVHLERALRLGDRLGGHLVQGHVDGVGKVMSLARERESHVLWISLPQQLSRYIAPKGSICIDGVSLTVNECDDSALRVNIVPHTAETTRLGSLTSGHPVNLEVDVLAKYVERLMGGGSAGTTLSLETLKKHGFT